MSDDQQAVSRRRWLEQCSTGFGAVALTGMLQDQSRGGESSLPSDAAMKRFHHAPKAKHVIFCYMSGGVSHVDSFDPKPKLKQLHGKPMPVKVERTQFNRNGNVMASPFEFSPWGESGIEISNMFPEIGKVADELAVIRSMTTPVNEHAQGNFVMHSGFPFMGHPSAGAWCSYGLGNENENLARVRGPAERLRHDTHGGVSLFSNGFLPAQHQGSILKADQREAIRNIRPRDPESIQQQRLRFARSFDEEFLAATSKDNQVEAADSKLRDGVPDANRRS